MTRRSIKPLAALAAGALTISGLTQLPSSGTAEAATTMTATGVSAQADDSALTTALDNILDNQRLANANESVMVRDAETGDVLYERRPDARANPASNNKIFTSMAAMDTLGAGTKFSTDVLGRRTNNGRTITKNLYLRGGGDPTMLVGDYRALARQLRKEGVRKVNGDLVADDSYFDDVPLGSGWSWGDESYYYSAVTSGLTLAPNTDYDSGTVIVQTTPREVGAKVQLRFAPKTEVVKLVNRSTTGAPGSKDTINVERAHGTNVITVTGSMPADAAMRQHWVTVPDPTSYAANVFARALRSQGIRVRGDVRTGTTPKSSKVLASHDSMTVAQLLTPFLKLSNNMHAEDLTKAMGRAETGKGTWPAGRTVITDYLKDKGLNTDGLRISDGSGLSRLDLVSARNVTDALLAAQKESWYPTWYKALPIAGDPDRLVGGTLRSRMQDTPAADNLHGKTGSLTSVSALSGYVTNADGRKLVFSMLSNNYLGNDPKDLEDQVGVTLASWSEKDNAVANVNPRSLSRKSKHFPQGIECSWAKAC